jgi:hypothetical protein
MISGEMGRLPRAGVLGGWMRAVAAKFRRPAKLKNTNRAEFEQIARDLDLSPPQLYGLLTGRALSPAALERRLSDLETSAEISPETDRTGPRQPSEEERRAAEMRDLLMFGPFCC